MVRNTLPRENILARKAMVSWTSDITFVAYNIAVVPDNELAWF